MGCLWPNLAHRRDPDEGALREARQSLAQIAACAQRSRSRGLAAPNSRAWPKHPVEGSRAVRWPARPAHARQRAAATARPDSAVATGRRSQSPWVQRANSATTGRHRERRPRRGRAPRRSATWVWAFWTELTPLAAARPQPRWSTMRALARLTVAATASCGSGSESQSARSARAWFAVRRRSAFAVRDPSRARREPRQRSQATNPDGAPRWAWAGRSE